ncbi:MAG: phosphatidylcholine and lysophosphatidylcholine phospholipase [Chrysothrix sp. TS-e1954]|nr:MAG: phosphatidylcholine and lysophosphatidylcholine phospholipase [Chrysothrix sp. TS-e1954]
MAESTGSTMSSITGSTSQVRTVSMVTSTDSGDSALFAIGRFIYAILKIIPGFSYWTITFLSITLPQWLYLGISTSVTITMNATTLFLGNMYQRLPPEPQRKEPHIELFPDVPDGDSKRGLSNYLDEFLSAIKVFGYLERSVFHELTRTMQTRKLIAGETILLEEEKGFCLVVDGLVQIFVKSQKTKQGDPQSDGEHMSHDDDEERNTPSKQGYQLLTEVKNGAPLSSLFSILSLFTEDVKLRYDESEYGADAQPQPTGLSMNDDGAPSSGANPSGFGTPYSTRGSPRQEPISPQRDRTRRRGGSLATTNGHQPVPPLSLDPEHSNFSEMPRKHTSHERTTKRRRLEAHPDIVARATVDTTIAIIPATAFKRLTRVYPKASAHIVQVILTRLQRVTLTTGHAYLGLTSEVSNTEKLMNRYTTYDLPGILRGSALDRLKDKFSKERARTNAAEGVKGIALHKQGVDRRRRSSAGLRREATTQARTLSVRMLPEETLQDGLAEGPASPESEKSNVNAGDLLTNIHSDQRGHWRDRLSVSQPFQTASTEGQTDLPSASYVSQAHGPFQPQRQESRDEDALFRESIVDCMLKAIGLTDSKGVIQKAESVEQSPRLMQYDAKRQKAVFSNAFGFLDAFDADGDTESLGSVPASATSNAHVNQRSIRDELSSDIEIVFFPKDAVLVEQGERNPGLYYVIDGFLDVSVTEGNAEPASNHLLRQSNDPAPRTMKKSLYLTKPGGLAGYLGTISSRRSFVEVSAKTDVYVGFLPRASIERIVERFPIVLLTIAKRLTSLLPRLILHIDFALEWTQVDAGQAVYRQGDEADAIYIVLNGRLRSLQTKDGKVRVIGEYGQGDSVGELEVLTESRRPGTLHAIRDTELAKLPKTLFNSLALENPEITIKISKIIANRMRDLTDNPVFDNGRDHSTKASNNLTSSNVNLRTVCILPVTAGVPVVEFGSRLLNALTQIGTTNGATTLNHTAILNHLGRHAFSRMGKLKLSQHLADLEEKYGLVLYVADTNVNSPWTQTCISQADCILLVGLAEDSSNIGEYERFLLTTKTTARKELVLLHAERYCPPGLTRTWLRNRSWINGSHHHIHMSFRNSAEPIHPQTRRFGSALKQRVQVLQAEIQKYTSRRVSQTPLYSSETPFKGDFHRLARRLIGKSVGLVLGGGGARGIAHIGIIRALEEAGIPIDLVGGTSIGAFVGALYAWDADMVPMWGRAKKFAGRMGSMWRFALDLTYPSASYTTGHEFNRGIFKTFGTAHMEDFWLEFYCNTTNISKSRPEIHTSGHVWRYIRASMSLAGLVPPLCDEGSLLVDGGYLDNLTVAHMKSLGADVVFAIDVGSIDDQTPQLYGDSLSGFYSLWNRWNPFSSTANPPTLSEIQARLAYVSSVDALERAKTTPGCRYMRPPVWGYGTLDFAKFEELADVGYVYAKRYLEDLRREGVLPVWEESGEERKMRRTMAPRRASI